MTESKITLTADPPKTSLSSETLFQILENKRRRIVIQQLHRSDDPRMDAHDLAEIVAAHEGTSERSCYISLIQNHLQKLDDEGIVEYDHDSKIAEPASYDLATLAWFIEHGQAATNTA